MATSPKSLTAKTDSLHGDWTVVLPRRGKNRTHSSMKTQEKRPLEQPVAWVPVDSEIDSIRESKLLEKLQLCSKKLESSKYFVTLLDQIESTEIMNYFHKALGSEKEMQMVIYGIGSIESYENPRLQLSLALLLKRKFSWIGTVEVFDPVLSVTESRVLESLGCSVMSVNEQGRRKANKPTMFYMPHCEAELYDNLLQENWRIGLLNNIVLFGNSFEHYEDLSKFKFKNTAVTSARHVLSVRKFTDEFKIETASDYFGAFHDSSWHFFSPEVDTGLPFISNP